MQSEEKQIPIWFFVGVLLAIYGVLICASGIYDCVSPPENKVALWNLHAGIWWGLFLVVVGVFYVWKFRPGKTSAETGTSEPKK